MYFFLTIFLTQVLYSCLHLTEVDARTTKCITDRMSEDVFEMNPIDDYRPGTEDQSLICDITEVCIPVNITSIAELKKAPLILKTCYQNNRGYMRGFLCEEIKFSDISTNRLTYYYEQNDLDAKVYNCAKKDDIHVCTRIQKDAKKERARLIDEFICAKSESKDDKPEENKASDVKPEENKASDVKPEENKGSDVKPEEKVSTKDKSGDKLSTNDNDLVAIVATDVVISNPAGDVVKRTRFNLKDVIEARIEETFCTVAEGCRVVRQKFAPSAP